MSDFVCQEISRNVRQAKGRKSVSPNADAAASHPILPTSGSFVTATAPLRNSLMSIVFATTVQRALTDQLKAEALGLEELLTAAVED